MKILAGLTVLALTTPAHAANAALYDRLEAMDYLQQGYVATRTKQGINFNSKARMNLPGIPEHPRRHIEIEGPSPTPVASLRTSLDAAIAATEPDVDTTYRADENTRHGLNITTVDVNGVDVAFLSYRSAREPDAYCRRALIHTPKGDYVATMSMHGASPRDRAGMALEMLVIDMVNSGLLTRTEPSWLRRFAPAK
jgi:hypothetical protein